MQKFKEFWKTYRAVIVIVLAVSGVGAPVVSGVMATGDALAEVQTDGTNAD